MPHLPVLLLPFGLGYSYYYGFTPLLLPLLFFGASIITYLMYAKDKSAAENNRWRTPESTLHLYSLLGGWPGAIVAQQRLRHKTIKKSFRSVFWITVAINVAAIGWLHTDKGNRFLYGSVAQLEGYLLSNVTDRSVFRTIKVMTRFNRKSVNYIYKSSQLNHGQPRLRGQ